MNIDVEVLRKQNVEAHEQFINHLMDNKFIVNSDGSTQSGCCYAPKNKYCETGLKLKKASDEAFKQFYAFARSIY